MRVLAKSLAVAALLVFSGLLASASPTVAASPPSGTIAATGHGPIFIGSNAGFTGGNGVVSGNGTPADPYVISGWLITGGGGNGITIQNTNASFVIRDVVLANGSAYSAGISFQNVSNGAVENTTIEYGWTYGIILNAASTVAVSNSTFRNLGSNANVYIASDITFARDVFVGSPNGPGISANYTTGSRFMNNSISGTYIGISVGYNSSVDVVGNQVVFSTIGIAFFESRGSVEGNNVTNNADGLTAGTSANLTVVANRFGWNGGTGIALAGSTGVHVYGNDLVGNGIEATDDMGPQNSWDNGYPGGGNYWSNYTGVDQCHGPLQNNCTGPDGIGDTPLIIDSDSVDRYPLMNATPTTPPPPPPDYTLYGSATQGWGLSSTTMTIPGPTLSAIVGHSLTLGLVSADGATHAWFLDLNNNDIPDAGEPLSPMFNGTAPLGFTFTPNQVGTFTYRCEIHPTTMRGLLIVYPAVPQTNLTLTGQHGLNGWFVSSVNVSMSATGPPPGPWSTFYRINGSAWVPYSGPFVIGTPGTNLLEYYSADTSGDVEPVRNATVKVDLLGPSIQLNLSGNLTASTWYNTPVTWTFSQVSSVASPVGVRCALDGNVSDPCPSSGVISTDGVHAFTYNGTDAAGLSSTPVVLYIPIDTQAPSTALSLVGTLGSKGWYTSMVTATVMASDNASGVSAYFVRVDNGSWASRMQFELFTGVHYVQYRSVDRAGNWEAPKALVVSVDAAGPTFLSYSSLGTLTTSSVTISWSATDTLSGVSEYMVAVDGEPARSVGNASSYTGSFADGDHLVEVFAVSGAGSVSSVAIRFRVDTSLFSPTGPYGLAIPIAIVVLAVAAVAILTWLRIFRRRPPTTSKEPPEPPEAP